MAERPQAHQLQVHPQRRYEYEYERKGLQRGPSASKVLAVLTGLPVGGTLLGLSGLTLAATLLGLAVTTPLFILFSPILVPAAIVICLAVTAILASGAFGITAISSLSWVYNCLLEATGTMPGQMEQAKRRMQEVAGYVGQKTKDLGQDVQSWSQEEGKRT